MKYIYPHDKREVEGNKIPDSLMVGSVSVGDN